MPRSCLDSLSKLCTYSNAVHAHERVAGWHCSQVSQSLDFLSCCRSQSGADAEYSEGSEAPPKFFEQLCGHFKIDEEQQKVFQSLAAL